MIIKGVHLIVLNKHLFPSNPNAESTETGLDFLSNGFKFRDGDAHQNGSGSISSCFAEQPKWNNVWT